MPAEVATSAELDAVDVRVEAVETDLTALEGRVGTLEQTPPGAPVPYDDTVLREAVDRISTRIGTCEGYLDELDLDVTKHEQRLIASDQAVSDLARRVEVLEARPTGSTSGAQVGLPYTVITEPSDAAVQAGLRAWRSRFSGEFALTKLAFAFKGEARLTTPLEAALGTGKMQGVRWEGLAKRATVLSWARTDVPLFTSFGLLRNFRFEDFTLKSTAPRDTAGHGDAKGFLLRSNQAPKNNTDGAFTDIEWMGAWDYGLGLAGDANANENSEYGFLRVAFSNDASFRSAWLWSGAGGGTEMQQNQFLNYSFRDTKFEHSHGDVLRFDYGGSIHCDGFNSWIMTGQAAPGGTPVGRFVYLPKGYNFDSTMFMDLTGVRPELRTSQVKLLDSAWSGAGGITITGVNSASYASRHNPFESITLRGNCPLLVQSSYLDGYIGVRGSASPRIVLINTAGPKVDWSKTDGSSGSGVQKFDTANPTVKVI